MSGESLLRDVEFLAGRLPHRGGVTENERLAAEYLHGRFEASTPLVQTEDFHSMDAYPHLFALYYLDFSVAVCAIAYWWPWIGLAYGLASFLMYLGEFTGYSTMSRFLPHYETQNVSARFPCRAPERLVVLTAHYDSPKVYPWTAPGGTRRLRWIHIALVCCMALMLISCAAEGLNVFAEFGLRFDLIVRWTGAAVLLGAAVSLYTGARASNFTRGANSNAAGAAVLLALAEGLRDKPLESTEVWLVATGSKEMWLSGMRQLFRGLEVDKASTYFINVAGVGAGSLRYVTGEGMMHVYRADRELVDLAESHSAEFGAKALVHRGLPTDALIPLARGYKAMSIVATGEDDLPVEWNQESDTVDVVEPECLVRAAGYVERIVRGIDSAAVTK